MVILYIAFNCWIEKCNSKCYKDSSRIFSATQNILVAVLLRGSEWMENLSFLFNTWTEVVCVAMFAIVLFLGLDVLYYF